MAVEQVDDRGWAGRVEFSEEGGAAYVPDQVLVVGPISDEQIEWIREEGLRLHEREGEQEDIRELVVSRTPIHRFFGDGVDVPAVVRRMQAQGMRAQPNHVLFADSCGCCPPHPAMHGGGGAQGNPVWANPVWANPVWANPVWANPVWANPVWESRVTLAKFLATGERRSTAKPAEPPEDWIESGAKDGAPSVVVIDTGYPDEAGGFRPAFVPGALDAASSNDVPDAPLVGQVDGDDFLDPVAGHGTFIAGLIERAQPGCPIEVQGLVKPEGDVDEATLVAALEELRVRDDGPPDLVNLSLSGYAFEEMEPLALAVEALQAGGTVIVASAGNDGICTPTYPASLPGVVSVGAIGPGGPAPFSNYGPWVRACAPGVDIVSSFFNAFNGAEDAVAGTDPDDFKGWARWSGTSFSAPIVVGALARAMVSYGLTPKEAVKRVIDEPELMRSPGLGTVVNVV